MDTKNENKTANGKVYDVNDSSKCPFMGGEFRWQEVAHQIGTGGQIS